MVLFYLRVSKSSSLGRATDHWSVCTNHSFSFSLSIFQKGTIGGQENEAIGQENIKKWKQGAQK
jgi:hypothetical protein